MAVPLSLSLQAFPPVDNDKQSLQYLISRINDQKGSFRNVSEQSLEDEIQVTENNQAVKDQEDVIETFEGAEAAIIKVEEVSSVREEVIRQILLAHNESVQALDFVSLLLSGKVPAVAQTTITPYIRQSLPLGSLGGEAVQTLQSPEVDEHNQGMELIGWRMQSLNGAADSLLKAASRLEEEIAKETTYWSQVLAVNEKGWSLSRLPKEQHTLGVRYGFAEAYADFRDRGLAALRRNEDGSIHIDRGARSKDSSRLRVRILENGKPIGSSVQSFSDALGDQPLEQEMLDARNSIFDEELHHELHQEARDLVNQGVRCVDSRVLLPYEIDKQIEIDIIPVMDENSSESYDKSTLADIVAISLRILIAHAHCQSLRKRSQVPPPLREHQVPRPIYNLLKPVIEWLHHKSQVQALQNMLESLQKLLSAAGLNFSFDLLGQSGHGPVTLDTATQKTVLSSTIDILLQTLTSPHYTKIRLWLLDEQMALTIDVHTALQRYGTSFQFSVGQRASSLIPTYLARSIHFTDLSALRKHMIHLTTLMILQYVVSSPNPSKVPWRMLSPHSHSIMRNKLDKQRDREVITINLSESTLILTCQRNGIQVEQVTWTGTDRVVEDERESRILVNICRSL